MKQRGFTLMELIGVMAILAILAAVIAPSIVGSVNEAYRTAETKNLERMMRALEDYVRRNGRIPSADANDWPQALATLLDVPLEAIANNRRGHTRRLYFDPNFFSVGSGFSGYTQTAGLASAPLSPRVMLISNLRGNAPNPGNDPVVFDDIWHQRPTAALVEGETLLIERLNLARLFKEVVATNAALVQPAIAFNAAAPTPLPAAGIDSEGMLLRFVLQDSRVALYSAPYPTGALQSIYKVSEDIGLRYAAGGGGFAWTQP